MTSRLKRKLGDIGVDASSRKANESFCLIGTPLPPLEKSRDTGEFVPLWKQDVRDEKGRRRLHGAFTGGFSAGYFNTVGSKEGWTPSTFVSSRSDKSKNRKQQRAEDFMDDEDRAEMMEGRRIVDTTEEMDLLGGTEAEIRARMGEGAAGEDPLPSTLQSLLPPAPTDSPGARILKKMGWRLGSGIGPRLTKRDRDRQDRLVAAARARAGGITPTNSTSLAEEEDEDMDPEASKHLYLPRDTPVLVVNRKDNSHGLGYKPSMSLNDSIGASGSGTGGGGSKISAGFGLGALNDADDDDVDIYDGTSTSRNRTAYDIADNDDIDHTLISLGGSRRNQNSNIGSSRTSRVKEAQAQEEGRVFRDGSYVLTGFVVSGGSVADDRWYPLPDVPKGWTPDPHRVWALQPSEAGFDANKENSTDKSTNTKETVPHWQWKSGMSADERGTILGETPLPAAKKSVFDYMSQKDRERLKGIAASLHAPSPPGPSGTSSAVGPSPAAGTPDAADPSDGRDNVPRVDPSIARAALRGFQPFRADPAKQARYESFLRSQADPGSQSQSTSTSFSSSSLSELREFAASAQIFRPVSGAMAGRFTSASSGVVEVQNSANPAGSEGGLYTPSHAPMPTPTSTSADKKASGELAVGELGSDYQSESNSGDPSSSADPHEKTAKQNAARLGMYGPLTRETKAWRPAKLLCKRFGVREPEILDENVNDSLSGTGGATATPTDAPSFESAGASAQAETVESGASGRDKLGDDESGGGGAGGVGGGPRDITNIGLGEDPSQGRDTLSYERPEMDVFKAIFASDDEDSGDEDGDGDGLDVIEEPALKKPNAQEVNNEGKVKDGGMKVTAVATVESKPEPIDLTTFKPTFVRREARTTKDADEVKDQSKKKEKKEKKKEKRKAIVSFMDDVDIDAGIDSSNRDAEAEAAPKKKRRKDRDKDKGKGRDKVKKKDLDRSRTKDGKDGGAGMEDDDEDMWVEKPAPAGVHPLPLVADMPSAPAEPAPPPKGRKRAIDFM